jgi:hypothetical protein
MWNHLFVFKPWLKILPFSFSPITPPLFYLYNIYFPLPLSEHFNYFHFCKLFLAFFLHFKFPPLHPLWVAFFSPSPLQEGQRKLVQKKCSKKMLSHDVWDGNKKKKKFRLKEKI